MGLMDRLFRLGQFLHVDGFMRPELPDERLVGRVECLLFFFQHLRKACSAFLHVDNLKDHRGEAVYFRRQLLGFGFLFGADVRFMFEMLQGGVSEPIEIRPRCFFFFLFCCFVEQVFHQVAVCFAGGALHLHHCERAGNDIPFQRLELFVYLMICVQREEGGWNDQADDNCESESQFCAYLHSCRSRKA